MIIFPDDRKFLSFLTWFNSDLLWANSWWNIGDVYDSFLCLGMQAALISRWDDLEQWRKHLPRQFQANKPYRYAVAVMSKPLIVKTWALYAMNGEFKTQINSSLSEFNSNRLDHQDSWIKFVVKLFSMISYDRLLSISSRGSIDTKKTWCCLQTIVWRSCANRL